MDPRILRRAVVLITAAALAAACGAREGANVSPASRGDETRGPGVAGGAAAPPTMPSPPSGAETGAPSSSPPWPDAGGPFVDGSVAARPRCETTFRYVPPEGERATRVEVTGEWTGWSTPGLPLTRDPSGAFVGTFVLPARGLVAYKFLVDGEWRFDPEARYRKYDGAVENSAVLVEDCEAPRLVLAEHDAALDAAGKGRFRARVRFEPGRGKSPLAPTSLGGALRRAGRDLGPAPVRLEGDGATASVDVAGLAPGKYTVVVTARAADGRAAKPLRLVFWIERDAFSYGEALFYSLLIDRFRNGDPTNDAPKTAGLDPRVDFEGGDLQGVRDALRDGTFDALGVRALVLSPFVTNPAGPQDGAPSVAGYHGYWPVRARDIDPRFGNVEALREVVAEAHARGIRVLVSLVLNHVHESHEYRALHPDWFRVGCPCGEPGCDAPEQRLACVLDPRLPDVDWTNSEASEQLVADALHWLEEHDLDGFQLDELVYLEPLAIRNLASRVHDELEATGVPVYLTGEAPTPRGDCPRCREEAYAAVAPYLGKGGLDGVIDGPLREAVPVSVFAHDAFDMGYVERWLDEGRTRHPAGTVTTPYLGSHDFPRFLTLATYRGQPGFPADVPERRWSHVAAPPGDDEPYARQRLALAWLFTQPGAPLVYAGDEYGEWGGADPNNRHRWRSPLGLDAHEQKTLLFAQKLGRARRELSALRRGAYVPLGWTPELLAFAREETAGVAVVVLGRRGGQASFPLPPALGFRDGAVLRDRLGGPSVVVTAGAVRVALPAFGAALYAP